MNDIKTNRSRKQKAATCKGIHEVYVFVLFSSSQASKKLTRRANYEMVTDIKTDQTKASKRGTQEKAK